VDVASAEGAAEAPPPPPPPPPPPVLPQAARSNTAVNRTAMMQVVLFITFLLDYAPLLGTLFFFRLIKNKPVSDYVIETKYSNKTIYTT
jgi:hypothetical protein